MRRIISYNNHPFHKYPKYVILVQRPRYHLWECAARWPGKGEPKTFSHTWKIKYLLLFVKRSWKAVHPELCKVAVIDRSSFTSQTNRRSLLTLTYNVNNPVGIKDHTWRKASSLHRLARTSLVLARAVLGSFLIWQNKIHLKDHCTTTLLSQRFEPKQLFKP